MMTRKSAGRQAFGNYWEGMLHNVPSIDAFCTLIEQGYIIWWSSESQRIFVRKSKKARNRIPPSVIWLQEKLNIDSKNKLKKLKEECLRRRLKKV